LSRVGIYGGTFDPIHNGHLKVVRQLIEKKLIDYLLVIPAGEPLLRENAPVASGPARLTMCQLAISSLPENISVLVEVSPIEILRTGPSYAIDTVEDVKQRFPNDEIFLIMGADAFSKLAHWHRSDELRKLVSILCINRPGYADNGIDIDALDVSASEIRSSASVDVPEIVQGFIRENRLYDN
jgi:nicotinate-nucleotide adenylyltransferase